MFLASGFLSAGRGPLDGGFRTQVLGPELLSFSWEMVLRLGVGWIQD